MEVLEGSVGYVLEFKSIEDFDQNKLKRAVWQKNQLKYLHNVNVSERPSLTDLAINILHSSMSVCNTLYLWKIYVSFIFTIS